MLTTMTPEQAIQNLVSMLMETTKRLTRVEAKLTQLMIHSGMHSDGRQKIDRRAQLMLQHSLRADGCPRTERRVLHA